ncbi:DUF1214 domain-containing protein [Afifella pfennigii]|uniref:DUF1214 domain-containing protein n=1 Tax=Afifella pfennigii TaxID=209897 RepID=UPI00047E1D2E|nr:DUF1214 domain-containing protein [Afifella pfennigii]
MRLLAILFGAVLGVIVGIASTYVTLRDLAPVDTIQTGAWKGWPRAGTPDEDPYSRAMLARTGELALGSSEGLKLLARTDDAGGALSGRCRYTVTGQLPAARLWTLTVESDQGANLPPPSRGARAIGSDQIVRNADGSFTVALAPSPQPGNWLSTEGSASIRLAARLYDTTARTVTVLTDFSVPSINKEACP